MLDFQSVILIAITWMIRMLHILHLLDVFSMLNRVKNKYIWVDPVSNYSKTHASISILIFLRKTVSILLREYVQSMQIMIISLSIIVL
jgi:hypothetical protein